MKDPVLRKRKIGDVLCDIGKYMLTVIPFTYFMADKPGVIYVIITTAVIGLFLTIFGIYFVSSSASKTVTGNVRKRKVRLLRNSVFVVEEEEQQ